MAPAEEEPQAEVQYREISVKVPEQRVEQFHRFFARFLEISERRGAGGPGRRRHGRCGNHRRTEQRTI